MSVSPVPRLNAALEGRYRVEREIGEGYVNCAARLCHLTRKDRATLIIHSRKPTRSADPLEAPGEDKNDCDGRTRSR